MNSEDLKKLAMAIYRRAVAFIDAARICPCDRHRPQINNTITDCHFVMEAGVFDDLEYELVKMFKILLKKASYRNIFIENPNMAQR